MWKSKITLTLLISVSSLLVTSQTFVLQGSTYIGKTKKEIEKINQANNSRILSKHQDGPINSVIYYDSLNSLANHFIFARTGPFRLGRERCFLYLVNVGNKSQFEKTKTDLQSKCKEKISDTHAIEYSGKKKYDWNFTSSDKSELYTFMVERYHKRRNNR